MTRLRERIGQALGRDAGGNGDVPGAGPEGLPAAVAEKQRGKSLAGQKIHLIGIGGCGMRGAAGLLLRRGATVSGSDRSESASTLRLAGRGARISVGQRAENVPTDADLVVISAAIKESNPELLEARGRGVRVVKYAELLGMLMADRDGVAIAGTHGKSTTTAMTAFVLKEAGLDPSFVVGAQVDQLGGGSGVGDGDPFVVEACEYDRSFLHLSPKYAAILNIEEDHLDCFSGLDEIVEAFTAFGSRVRQDGVLLVNRDDREAMKAAEPVGAKVETFGFDVGADWRAANLKLEKGCFSFDWLCGGETLARVKLSLPGRHNVCNALAAGAMAWHCGVSGGVIAKMLGAFRGADRRLTLRGRAKGITVVDDYAHHPTEIQATLRAAKDFYNPKRMWVVFQPHQHSRTRFLLNEFAKSFGLADVVVVPDIYFVRDSQAEADRIGSIDLVDKIHAHGGDARYIASFDEIAEHLQSELRSEDLVITMGAGDVWKIADAVVSWLGIDR